MPATLLKWSVPVILGAIEPEAMDRFWTEHDVVAASCVSEAVEVMLVVDARCTVAAVAGGDCLSEALVGAWVPAPHCGCGVAYVTQTLSRRRR